MMGVGKSTLGRSLSKQLNMRFIDLDRIIENKESMSIKDIFKKKGEKYFRDLEKKIGLKNVKRKNSVIALGGGTFVDENIRREILKNCISFWLDLDTKSILKRSTNLKRRPLLKNNNLKKTLDDIYSKRKKVYNLANFRINCNNASKSEIIKEIIQIYDSQ